MSCSVGNSGSGDGGSVCRDSAANRIGPRRRNENSFRVLKLSDKNTSRYKRYYVIPRKSKYEISVQQLSAASAISQLAEFP